MKVGSFLPHAELPAAPDGAQVALRTRGRRATVVVRVHDADCRDCRRYLQSLAESGIDLAWWEARVLVLVPGPLSDAEELRNAIGASFTVLSDGDGGTLPLAGAGIVIADRFGHVYHVSAAADAHEFPGPEELEEWLKFLATQCPE